MFILLGNVIGSLPAVKSINDHQWSIFSCLAIVTVARRAALMPHEFTESVWGEGGTSSVYATFFFVYLFGSSKSSYWCQRFHFEYV